MIRIFMSFLPVVTIVQKPESADQMGEKGTLLTVHMFKSNSNLIEGTRAQMSSGSKEINLIFFLIEPKFISSVLVSLLVRNLKNVCSLYLIFTAFSTCNCNFIFFRT